MTRTRVRYGPLHAQQADLWRPPGARGDLPVVVLIHGGFWKQPYTKRLMRHLARAVVGHGWLAYNIEYRRVGPFGQGGWPHTFEDVSAAVDALDGVPGVDRSRVVTCGHSAGGHLALWAASARKTDSSPTTSRLVRVRAAISLAGVSELVEAARLGLGGDAVQVLLGGEPDEVPDRYALASPASLLPLGVLQVLIHGTDDMTVPPTMSARYADRARDSGDDARFVPLPATGHMDVIDPRSAAFGHILSCLDEIVATPPG